MYRAIPSRGRIQDKWLDSLMTNDPVSIGKTCLNIFRLQPRIAGKNSLSRVPSGKHSKHMLDCQAASANDRLSTEDLRINRDAFQKLVLIHRQYLLRRTVYVLHIV